MDCLVCIENDLYDIASRVKEIDEDYYVVYNLKRQGYEIHHKKSRPTLSIVVGKELDQRVLNKLRETRIVRLNEIIDDIEKTNERIEQEKQKSLSDEARYKAKQICNYLGNGGSYLPPYGEI